MPSRIKWKNNEPTWNDLLAFSQITIGNRLTEKVRKQWKRKGDVWMRFCVKFKIPLDNYAEVILIAFCTWLVYHNNLGWSALRGYLYGVRELALSIAVPINVGRSAMPVLGAYLSGRKKKNHLVMEKHHLRI